MAEKEYYRLTRPRLRWSSLNKTVVVISPALGSALSARSSLWLGKDHLLGVDSSGYTETYKRFYFRDIQAITLRKTYRRLILGILSSAFVALFAVITIASTEAAASWVFGSIGGISLLILIINLVKGPTCRCQLRTAVQIEEMPSLNRVSKVHKVLDRIRPLIAAAQGQLTPEEISARMLELAGSSFSTASTPVAQPFPTADDSNLPPRMGS